MAYVKGNNMNSSNPISRDGILSKAKSIINGERQGTYGDAEDSFQTIDVQLGENERITASIIDCSKGDK